MHLRELLCYPLLSSSHNGKSAKTGLIAATALGNPLFYRNKRFVIHCCNDFAGVCTVSQSTVSVAEDPACDAVDDRPKGAKAPIKSNGNKHINPHILSRHVRPQIYTPTPRFIGHLIGSCTHEWSLKVPNSTRNNYTNVHTALAKLGAGPTVGC